MTKRALSVTLAEENILWLRAHARAVDARSLSEALDSIVARARHAEGAQAEMRSVVGLAEIDSADPDLGGADAAVREMFMRGLASRRSSGSPPRRERKRRARRG